MENKGVQSGDPSAPDVNFVYENEYKLYNAPAPDGYVIFTIPSSEPSSSSLFQTDVLRTPPQEG